MQVTSAASTSLAATIGPSTTGHLALRTPRGSATTSSYLFVPPPPRVASDVVFTGSVTVGGPYLTTPVNTTGKVALVAFDANAGQRVSVQGINGTLNGGGGCGLLYFYSALGVQLGSACSGTTVFIDALTLPFTGSYQLMQTQNWIYTGSIDLRVNSVVDVTGTITPGGAAVPVSITTPGRLLRFQWFAGKMPALPGCAISSSRLSERHWSKLPPAYFGASSRVGSKAAASYRTP